MALATPHLLSGLAPSHVYFPSEVELLFLSTGFERLEQYGDYAGRRLDHTSPYLITVGFTPPT